MLAAVGVAVFVRLGSLAPVQARAPERVTKADVLTALRTVEGWLEGDGSVLDSLAAGPAVIAIWSDTDPRCLEGLPRVQGWHVAYRRYGVRVIGVHDPEFSFGADPAVPRRIAQRLGLSFPIALDPSYLVRSRLASVVAGPTVLVLGSDPRTVDAVAFDDLDRVDHLVRRELRRARPDLGLPGDPETLGRKPARHLEVVHLGTGRVSAGPLANAVSGRTEIFTTQFRFQEEGDEHVPIPVGRWTPTAQGAIAARGGAADFIAIRTRAGRTFAVMSPGASSATRVWILADQKWLAAEECGADVRGDVRGGTYVDVAEPGLYEIVQGGRAHVLRISPEQPGLAVHAFVFEEDAAR